MCLVRPLDSKKNVKDIIVMKHVFSFTAAVVFLVGSAAGAEELLSTDELTFFENKDSASACS